eukprot:415658-Pleurochrysis_carterae.AAC.2
MASARSSAHDARSCERSTWTPPRAPRASSVCSTVASSTPPSAVSSAALPSLSMLPATDAVSAALAPHTLAPPATAMTPASMHLLPAPLAAVEGAPALAPTLTPSRSTGSGVSALPAPMAAGVARNQKPSNATSSTRDLASVISTRCVKSKWISLKLGVRSVARRSSSRRTSLSSGGERRHWRVAGADEPALTGV